MSLKLALIYDYNQTYSFVVNTEVILLSENGPSECVHSVPLNMLNTFEHIEHLGGYLLQKDKLERSTISSLKGRRKKTVFLVRIIVRGLTIVLVIQ